MSYDPLPDYITVVRLKRLHYVRLMRWSVVGGAYQVLREWPSRSKREAADMAQEWANQRGVELR